MKMIYPTVNFILVIAVAMAHRIHPLSDEFIDLINSKQSLWRAGRNFHRNTSLKYLKMLSGTIRNEEPSEDPHVGNPPRFKYTSLPLTFDAREKWKYCYSLNEIRDQGACGSCWAIATVSAMTDRICIQSRGKENFHFSEMDLISCCMYCGTTCSGGILEKAWQYAQKTGIVSGGEYDSNEGCKPYTLPPCEHKMWHHSQNSPCGHTKPKTVCKQKCRHGFIKKYRQDRKRIAHYFFHKDTNKIMSEIYERGPVTASFWVYEDFFSYKYGVYKHVTGKKLGLHSIKLIGWGQENGVPYWLAANSWNTDWGANGFFKIIRGDNHLGIEDIAYFGIFRLKTKIF